MAGRRIVRSLLLALSAAAAPAGATCPEDDAVAAYVADFAAGRASRGYGKDLNIDDAACARAKLVARLPAVLGAVVGYKAVFTNAESQRRFGVDGPGWGVMFAGGLHASGVRMPTRFGALPRYEPDFVVVVKDAGLAEAATPRDALRHIFALLPFVELPDIMLDKPSGAELIAANAAFRGGVAGTPIEVTPANAESLADALNAMEVIVTEERSGREIGRAPGSVLMGNPLNAAVWLAAALKRAGIALRPGDQLSLGGFLASAPVQAGTTISVRYAGLPGNPAVIVHFD